MPESRPKLVVLTGAGISAESGLKTFRESGGLWEGYQVEDVATSGAWERNPELVLRFYNERRRSLKQAQPNAAHTGLAELQRDFLVTIVTQNVDDLHERAGSQKVIHLHGELCKARSSSDEEEVIEIGYSDINLGDKCSRGSQLRPHIVWFGEAVPLMEAAIGEAITADAFAVVGTSLIVYPAANLVNCVRTGSPIFVVDPNRPQVERNAPVHYLIEKASTGVARMSVILRDMLL